MSGEAQPLLILLQAQGCRHVVEERPHVLASSPELAWHIGAALEDVQHAILLLTDRLQCALCIAVHVGLCVALRDRQCSWHGVSAAKAEGSSPVGVQQQSKEAVSEHMEHSAPPCLEDIGVGDSSPVCHCLHAVPCRHAIHELPPVLPPLPVAVGHALPHAGHLLPRHLRNLTLQQRQHGALVVREQARAACTDDVAACEATPSLGAINAVDALELIHKVPPVPRIPPKASPPPRPRNCAAVGRCA
mmetsp:Transcript_10792/g.44230  ORF Transcript_10792/g.44230 Transcript_10792/m.44230 type:complete len:246 (-) Transcript_10792:160-897(-)